MNSRTQAGPLKAPSPFGGRKVVDIDTHYSEPHDLWTKRAPAKFKDRVPRVSPLNGKTTWVIDGNRALRPTASPVSVVKKDGSKAQGMDFTNLSFADVHAACSDVKARLAYMDSCGIAEQILYPNTLGFGGQRASMVDPELRLISTKIYNDAVAELQVESGRRIFPMALLPWWDVKEMVKETRRAHEMGLRGVNITPDPTEHKDADGQPLPDLGRSHWDPFWEICQSLDMPVNFHIGASEAVIEWGSSSVWRSSSQIATVVIGSSMIFFSNAATVANLIFSGILDRYPNLKFVSVESGLGWVPFLMESMDYQYSQAWGKIELQRTPSEYLKKNIYTSFWFERRNLSTDIKAVGVDNVMFETDFPHPTCLYPIDDVASAFTGLDESEIQKVLSGNAARVYNLPV
ncbi:MAG: amidohydrolase [Rhodospirillaceae bacterium]|nr:MAG: amidohydrolase [Rhodospirillaceae bacterium]